MSVMARKSSEKVERNGHAGCSKRRGCKAREGSRNEAYIIVRRSDGSRAQHSRRAFFNSLRIGEGV